MTGVFRDGTDSGCISRGSPLLRLSRTWRDRPGLSSSFDRSGAGRLRRPQRSEARSSSGGDGVLRDRDGAVPPGFNARGASLLGGRPPPRGSRRSGADFEEVLDLPRPVPAGDGAFRGAPPGPRGSARGVWRSPGLPHRRFGRHDAGSSGLRDFRLR